MRVFVKSRSGKWLMPTKPCNARLLIKQGKARIIVRSPFTIQLLYETSEHTQPITVGIDDGGVKVGIAALSGEKVLYQEEITLRNDVRTKMEARRTYRRGRRHRKMRYRKPRFQNRRRTRRLPPSIQSKKDAIVQTLLRLPLPKPMLIRLEDAYFDFQAMENPAISGKQYQEGALLYEKNYKGAAKTRDGHQCRCCHTKDNLQVHHLNPKSEGGTDQLSNLMTLCRDCHRKHHQQGRELPKQKTSFYVFAAHVQQGKHYLKERLEEIAPVERTYGYITAHDRNKQSLCKSHITDAVIIGNRQSSPLSWWLETHCVGLRKRSLHEATARKGRKHPNLNQKRNQKNTFRLKGYQRWDCVKVYGKIGFISGFTGSNGCRVVDMTGSYLKRPGKSYSNINLSEVRKLYSSQGRVSMLRSEFWASGLVSIPPATNPDGCSRGILETIC